MSDTTALLSPEETAILKSARDQNRKRGMLRPPEIKLKNIMADVPGIPEGEYFTRRFNPETEEYEITGIGKTPSILILHRAYSYSYYSERLNKLVAWTSEITGFDDLSPAVYLYRSDEQGARIEKRGTYREVKSYMEEHYTQESPDGERRSLMTFQNVLYVLYGGTDPETNVYRMFVSNASAAGVNPEDGRANFKKPQEGSLLAFWANTQNRETAAFETVCRLGSRKVDGAKQYWLMTFTPDGESPNLPQVLSAYKRVQGDWALMQAYDVQRLSGAHAEATLPSL